ncbi:hypothetical protein [Paenibacillus etheri]|uniref:hypothetical protein n=1 Tax=Paenibacillus etheri TaxID=1306852 RepID=UPI001AE09AC3|nr:hypothetical protein [Paenibacillus etheri]
MFSPSAAVATACVLWRLLTAVRSACFHKQVYEVTSLTAQISLGKSAIFCSIYPLQLSTSFTLVRLWQYGLWFVMQPHPVYVNLV